MLLNIAVVATLILSMVICWRGRNDSTGSFYTRETWPLIDPDSEEARKLGLIDRGTGGF